MYKLEIKRFQKSLKRLYKNGFILLHHKNKQCMDKHSPITLMLKTISLVVITPMVFG